MLSCYRSKKLILIFIGISFSSGNYFRHREYRIRIAPEIVSGEGKKICKSKWKPFPLDTEGLMLTSGNDFRHKAGFEKYKDHR